MPYQLAVGKVRQDGRLIAEQGTRLRRRIRIPTFFLTSFLTQFANMSTEVRIAINVDAK